MDVRSCINFMLSSSQNTVFKYFSKRLSEYNITPAQYGVLNCLWQYGDISPSKIREILILEPSSVSGVLDRMQKNGLIERHIDQNNQRAIVVTLTEKSKAMKDGVQAIVKEMNDKFLAPFTEEEKAILQKMLLTIIDMND